MLTPEQHKLLVASTAACRAVAFLGSAAAGRISPEKAIELFRAHCPTEADVDSALIVLDDYIRAHCPITAEDVPFVQGKEYPYLSTR